VLFRFFLQLEQKRCCFVSAVVSRQAKVGGHADMINSVLALQRVTSSVLVCLKRKFFYKWKQPKQTRPESFREIERDFSELFTFAPSI